MISAQRKGRGVDICVPCSYHTGIQERQQESGVRKRNVSKMPREQHIDHAMCAFFLLTWEFMHKNPMTVLRHFLHCLDGAGWYLILIIIDTFVCITDNRKGLFMKLQI